MREFMEMSRALGDENRVRALMALRGGELCVCQLIEFMGLAPSTVSKHMAVLRQARLVDSEKKGRWVHYRLPGVEAPERIRLTLEWLFAVLGDDPRIREDGERVDAILRMDPEALCRNQAAG